MWLTPKNWLSPKRTRPWCASRWLALRDARAAQPNRRDQTPLRAPARGAVAAGAAGASPSIIAHDAIGRERGREACSRRRAGACFTLLGEVVDLRRVLLAAQVEPDLVGQVGRVAHRPAGLPTPGSASCALAQVELALLAVGGDAGRSCPRREILVDILRKLSSLQLTLSWPLAPPSKSQRAVDLVVDVAREHAVRERRRRPPSARRR